MSFIENGDMESFWELYDATAHRRWKRDPLIRSLLERIPMEDSTLAPTHRRLLKLRYGAGLSCVQIAERLGKSTTSIAAIHYRALRVLRAFTIHWAAAPWTSATAFWTNYDGEEGTYRKQILLTKYLRTLDLDSYPDLFPTYRKILELVRDGADTAKLNKEFNWELADMNVKKFRAINALRKMTIRAEGCRWQTPDEFWNLFDRSSPIGSQRLLARFLAEVENDEHIRSGLTDRRWQLLKLVAAGEPGKRIARILNYPDKTMVSRKKKDAIERLRLLTSSNGQHVEITQ